MLDRDGYRANIGIILLNQQNRVFWGRRKGEDSWQFPQGGLLDDEEIEVGMLRELYEEIGLNSTQIKIIAHTKNWLYYDVPENYNRNRAYYKGQKQIWFLLKLLGSDCQINLRKHHVQEFDAWRWLEYDQAQDLVIDFKRQVYTKALAELAIYLNSTQ